MTDNEKRLKKIIERLRNVGTYNPFAYFLIYLQTVEQNHESIVKNILDYMFINFMSYSAVFIAKNQTLANLYKLNFVTKGPKECASNRTVYIMDRCIEGKLSKRSFLFHSLLQQINFNLTYG